jgi:hypothetical protein
MCCLTRLDKIRNKCILNNIGVAPPIEAKMTENRLKWFGHLRRMPLEAPVAVRRVHRVIFRIVKSGRERPKMTLRELIK